MTKQTHARNVTMMAKQTHAQNVAAMDRKHTAFEQQASELLRCLEPGNTAQFDRFSASYLTAKGEAIARDIVGCDRVAAAKALRAGY